MKTMQKHKISGGGQKLHITVKETRLYLAGCCGSVAAASGSSLASSGGTGAAAGVGAGTGTGAGVVAGTAVDVEPESWAGGFGASEDGGEAAAVGFTFHQVKEKCC